MATDKRYIVKRYNEQYGGRRYWQVFDTVRKGWVNISTSKVECNRKAKELNRQAKEFAASLGNEF